MNLNLFKNKNTDNNFINEFIEELKDALKNAENEQQNTSEKCNELDEYNLYEKKKVFLDNKSRKANELVWIVDENSVCISENGDGGITSISKINLPENAKVGEVYEKIDGKYIYNSDITIKLKEIV